MDEIINKYYIKQPAGIGDIFYCLKIAKRILLDGKAKEVVWPVNDVFSYIGNYIKYPGLSFTSIKDYNKECILNEGNSILEIQSADTYYKDKTIMSAKYHMVGLKEDDALDYFEFERNYEREEKLFEKLQLDKNEKYAFISEIYGSPPNSCRHAISYNGKLRVIKNSYYEDVNLFDWCGVLENASEIYMVDTSFLYLMEKLNCKGSSFNLYSRYVPSNFDVIKHIPKKIKWNLVNW